MFLVAAIMQGILLVMCICWKVRQRRLRIDDFGRPLRDSPLPALPATANGLDSDDEAAQDSMEEDVVSISAEDAERSPLLNNRKGRKSRRRRWWTKWLATK